MELKGIGLSPDDRALLETKFSIDHPAELGDLVPKIEPGMEVLGVEFGYEIVASDSERHLWVDCGACGKRHNHKAGVVVKLDDDRRSTVGRDCAETRYEFKYRDHLDAFDKRRARRQYLEQVLAAYRHHDALVAAVDAIRNHRGVRNLIEMRISFGRRFGRTLLAFLQRYPDGVIYGKARRRDLGAERRRDSRLEKKLEEMARRRGKSRDDPAVDALLLADLAAAGDPDASKERLMVDVRVEAGRYAGVPFVTELERLGARLIDLHHRALHALDDVDGRDTAALSDGTLASASRRFGRVVNDIFKLREEIEQAAAFLDPANLKQIVDYANRWPPLRDAGLLFAIEGGLLSLKGGGPSLDLRLPDIELSTKGLEEILFDVTGRRRDAVQEALLVAAE